MVHDGACLRFVRKKKKELHGGTCRRFDGEDEEEEDTVCLSIRMDQRCWRVDGGLHQFLSNPNAYGERSSVLLSRRVFNNRSYMPCVRRNIFIGPLGLVAIMGRPI